MTVSVFLSATSSFICGHLLLWIFSIQLYVSDLQFYKHICLAIKDFAFLIPFTNELVHILGIRFLL